MVARRMFLMKPNKRKNMKMPLMANARPMLPTIRSVAAARTQSSEVCHVPRALRSTCVLYSFAYSSQKRICSYTSSTGADWATSTENDMYEALTMLSRTQRYSLLEAAPVTPTAMNSCTRSSKNASLTGNRWPRFNKNSLKSSIQHLVEATRSLAGALVQKKYMFLCVHGLDIWNFFKKSNEFLKFGFPKNDVRASTSMPNTTSTVARATRAAEFSKGIPTMVLKARVGVGTLTLGCSSQVLLFVGNLHT
mmetsp:Transcript_74692/g.242722  ORF Transcript_74692/g.242722 Transcript_74692/m.242722 type:complete len:250 (+) Transcript_74692:571-1320(+)